MFFKTSVKGRKPAVHIDVQKDFIIDMRKKFYSIQDIKVAMDASGNGVSESTIYAILKSEGFGRLPRRMKSVRQKLEKPDLVAAKSEPLNFMIRLLKLLMAVF